MVVDKIEETKLDEDEDKYMPEVSAELPEIDLIEKTQVVDIKLKDKMMVPEEEQVELEPKIPSIPIPPPEAEVDPVKKEIIPVEPSTMVSTETPVNEGKLITEKVEEIIPEHAEEIEVQIKPEVEEPLELFTHLEDAPAEADLKEEITAELLKPVEPSEPIPVEPPEIQQMEVDDDTIRPIDEELLITPKVEPKEEEEEEEVISEYPETAEIEIRDLPTKEVIEREAELRAEIIETEEAPPVTIKRETEPTDVGEIVPVVDVEEVEKLTIDEIAPRVDLTEVEEPKPGELPIVTEAPITEVEETIEQPVLEIDITKVKEEIEEVPERVFTPPVVPREEAEEETLPLIKEKEAEVPTLPKLTMVAEREEAVLEGKFFVFEAFKVEEKILIVEAQPAKATEALAVPVESPAKPRFVLDQRTKFEKRKLLHIIPEATKPLSTITVS